MANFRLYRKIYRVNYSAGTNTYTLFNPVSITAVVYLSNTVVEVVSVINESTGVYYAELTPTLYTNPNMYELRWTVQYTSDSSSIKNLRTFFTNESFVINQLNVFGEIDYEVDDNFISYEIQEQSEIILEILNSQ